MTLVMLSGDKIDAIFQVGDMGLEATGRRIRIARRALSLSQVDLALHAGIGRTTLTNTEKGAQFPSRELMKYLYRQHRVDFNFILNGDHAQLPFDVRAALIEAGESEPDRK